MSVGKASNTSTFVYQVKMWVGQKECCDNKHHRECSLQLDGSWSYVRWATIILLWHVWLLRCSLGNISW